MIDIERALRTTELEWPEADVADRVMRRVREPRSMDLRWLRPALAVAVAMILLVATPPGRQVVANVLEVAGIEIGWGDVAAGVDLELGEEVGLADVEGLIPADAPDAVYEMDGYVHIVWFGGGDLPAAGDFGVAVLYTQSQGTIFTNALKTLGPDTDIQPVWVRGVEGVWIEGAEHNVELAGQEVRLAANVLLWQEGSTAHRIETTGALEEALELAESLSQPAP